MIRTVSGEIQRDQLGPTLAHEHLCCDISHTSGKADNCMLDWELIVQELEFFKNAGGRGILEVTPVDLNADPAALRRIAEASGVHIVRGISFYQEACYPEWLRSATVDRITEFFVREIEEGQEGVPAGFIGEIGSHNQPEPGPGWISTQRGGNESLSGGRVGSAAHGRTHLNPCQPGASWSRPVGCLGGSRSRPLESRHRPLRHPHTGRGTGRSGLLPSNPRPRRLC